MQIQVRITQAAQKPWKSNTSGTCPCRYATMQKVQNKYQSGEHREDSLRYSTWMRLFQIPVTVQMLRPQCEVMRTNRHCEAGDDIRVFGHAMKTFTMRVDTAHKQRNRHFSRAREGEVTCEKRSRSSKTADHIVVTYFPGERVHSPRTNNHEVWQCLVVVLEEAANHVVVNYHKVQL